MGAWVVDKLLISSEEPVMARSGREVWKLSPGGMRDVWGELERLPRVDVEDWVEEMNGRGVGKEVMVERKMLRHVRDSAWGRVSELFGVHRDGPCMCKLCEYARMSGGVSDGEE